MSKNKVKIIYKKLGREKVRGQNVWAICYPNGKVLIDSRVKSKRKMGLLIHEVSHYCLPDATEKQILKLEKIITDVLWAQNYRQVDQ